MISAPMEGAAQQWQLAPASTYAQPVTFAVDVHSGQAFACGEQQPAWCPPLSAPQHTSHPVLMMPVAPQSYDLTVNGGPVGGAMLAVPTTYQFIPGSAVGVTSGCEAVPGDMSMAVAGCARQDGSTYSCDGSGYWQPALQVNVVPAAPSGVYYVCAMEPPSTTTMPSPGACPPYFADSTGQLAQHSYEVCQTVAPEPVAPKCLDIASAIWPHASVSTAIGGSNYSQALTQQAPEVTPETDTLYGQHAPTNVFASPLSELAQVPEETQSEGVEIGRDGFRDVASDCCSSPDDGRDQVCWDFDIHAALLIREQRDSNSYASSDASTAVSRSARRRRGRRIAKAKAKASMVILDSPPTSDLLVSEERKSDLMQQLEAGGSAVRKAISCLTGAVLRMSLEPFGCRVVQLAFEVANAAEKERLASELRNHVRLLISSPHGNFVIQKVIEVLPVSSSSFVADELANCAVEVAQHRFGCRVLSRLVEHHLCDKTPSQSANGVIDELLLDVEQLIRHNFGRHVLELLLEHGSDAHRRSIANAIRSNLFHYAKNRCASYVIEKALMFCSPADKRAISADVAANRERLLTLAVHECGMHVLKAVLKSRTEGAHKAKEAIMSELESVRASKHGKRLLEEI